MIALSTDRGMFAARCGLRAGIMRRTCRRWSVKPFGRAAGAAKVTVPMF
jgi:hypothetical protein